MPSASTSSQARTNRIYLDNAATSFPKPPEVLDAMTDYANRLGASPGRGAYAEAREAGDLLFGCRERLNTLFNGEDARNVVFTLNTSDALNIAIRGVLGPYILRGEKPHVITTHLDHNSVLRPYNELVARGQIKQARVACDPQTGLVDPADIQKAI
ncbi:MAG: aminotransferase class V-fold PLP-dependent enzyme, partial [Planctomycetota bacterium]